MIEDLAKATQAQLDAEWRDLLKEQSQPYQNAGDRERVGRRMSAIVGELGRRRREREKELTR